MTARPGVSRRGGPFFVPCIAPCVRGLKPAAGTPRSPVPVIGVIGAGLIGVPLGLLAGYAGGWVDNVIMRIADVKMSIPAVLLIINSDMK